MSEANAIDQAQPQSIEDRIAAQFGLTDEPEEAAPEATQPEEASEGEQQEPVSEPAEVEIEYDGERFSVPRKLEKAIMQEADYTRKTQALAEERRQVQYLQKAVESAKAEREFNEAIGPQLQQLQLIDNYLAQARNVNVADLDIQSGMQHLAQLQQAREHREALKSEIETRKAEHAEQRQQRMVELRQQAAEVIGKTVGPLKPEDKAALKQFTLERGYSESDFDAMELDPRAFTLINDAYKWRQLQANKAAAVGKATSASPAVKPGASANAMPQHVRNKLAFQKSMKSATTSQDKARLIEQRLSGMF